MLENLNIASIVVYVPKRGWLCWSDSFNWKYALQSVGIEAGIWADASFYLQIWLRIKRKWVSLSFEREQNMFCYVLRVKWKLDSINVEKLLRGPLWLFSKQRHSRRDKMAFWCFWCFLAHGLDFDVAHRLGRKAQSQSSQLLFSHHLTQNSF